MTVLKAFFEHLLYASTNMSFMHLSLFNPATTLCGRNCYIYFMGKETENREVINLFRVTQGVAEPGFNLRLSDSITCATFSLLSTACVSIHLRTGAGP